jgi:Icc-related predicted phosphoesterase
MNNTKHIAVFGDTHGHLRLMFQLCRLWQIEHQIHLDAVFQCGDLGYFPNPENLDKATRRYVKKDPEELGFKYFVKPKPEKDAKLAEILSGDKNDLNSVSCPVYFCHGNHEDFQELASEVGNASIKAIDFFERLHWLRPGHVLQIEGIKVASLGGGAEAQDTPEDDHGLDEPWKWVNNKACEQLIDKKFDILLSHTSPKGIGGASDQWGSERLRTVIELCQPEYNFFAHHKEEIMPANIDKTKCHWLNDVNFIRGNRMIWALEKGCMGILIWEDEDNHEFEIIDEPWMQKVDSLNWWTI